MEFSNKKLQKAFEYYENGKYKEALKICSKVLNKEYNNEDALTLEGEVLFKSGRIDDAIITWKINAEYNNNELAKKHLARIDSGVKEMALSYTSIYSEDEEYKRLIIDAYKESKKDDEPVKDELKDYTLDKSKDDNKKDESVSKENTTLSSKEPKLKEEIIEKTDESKIENKEVPLEKTSEKVIPIKKDRVEEKTSAKVTPIKNDKLEEKTTSIEKEKSSPIKNEVSEEKTSSIKKDIIDEKVIPIIKEDTVKETEPKVDVLKRDSSNDLKQTRVEKHCTSKNSFNKKIVALIVAAVIVVGGGIAIYKANTAKAAPEKPKVEQPKIDWTGFNTNVQTAINNQNYSELYTLLTKAPEKEVPTAEQASYQAGLKAMDQDGVQYFYDQGMNYYNQQQYKQAIDSFQQGLKFAQNNYLAPHLTYYIGASYSGLGNHPEAVEYYKLYLKNFPNDDIYNSGCLYVLAKYYYAQGHVKEAQSYANQLQDKYPNSPYNNTDISNILNNK